jgi:hypothetical protein
MVATRHFMPLGLCLSLHMVAAMVVYIQQAVTPVAVAVAVVDDNGQQVLAMVAYRYLDKVIAAADAELVAVPDNLQVVVVAAPAQ